MKPTFKILLSAALVLFAGCTFNLKVFTVVGALKLGMTAQEAQATINSNGFTLAQTLSRPDGGWWPADKKKTWKTLTAPDWWASRIEVRTDKRVSFVEYYPLRHMMGFSQLFLFYGQDGRLVHIYDYTPRAGRKWVPTN